MEDFIDTESPYNKKRMYTLMDIHHFKLKGYSKEHVLNDLKKSLKSFEMNCHKSGLSRNRIIETIDYGRERIKMIDSLWDKVELETQVDTKRRKWWHFKF
jgi:hypothetical protein